MISVEVTPGATPVVALAAVGAATVPAPRSSPSRAQAAVRRASNTRAVRSSPNVFMRLATPRGFEPPISTVTGWHVRPLHHGAGLNALSRARLILGLGEPTCQSTVLV